MHSALLHREDITRQQYKKLIICTSKLQVHVHTSVYFSMVTSEERYPVLRGALF